MNSFIPVLKYRCNKSTESPHHPLLDSTVISGRGDARRAHGGIVDPRRVEGVGPLHLPGDLNAGGHKSEIA